MDDYVQWPEIYGKLDEMTDEEHQRLIMFAFERDRELFFYWQYRRRPDLRTDGVARQHFGAFLNKWVQHDEGDRVQGERLSEGATASSSDGAGVAGCGLQSRHGE